MLGLSHLIIKNSPGNVLELCLEVIIHFASAKIHLL